MKKRILYFLLSMILSASLCFGASITKGLIGKEDINTWNGADATFTRSTSAGYTATLHPIDWPGVDALKVYGGGVNRTNTTIASALTAIGTSNKVTVWLSPGTWTFSANVDWSSYKNVTFSIPPGALISHSTYTINMPNLVAGIYQVFSGTGTVTLSGKTKVAIPEWWGPNTTAGTTDMTAEIQAALNSGITSTSIGNETYLISTTLTIKEDTTLFGSGNISVIKAAADFGDNPLIKNSTTTPGSTAARDDNIYIHDLYLDGNSSNNTTGTEFSHCISLITPIDSVIENVYCKSPKGDGIYIGNYSSIEGENIKIINNTVDSAVRQGIAVTGGEHLFIDGNLIKDGTNHGIDLEVEGSNVGKWITISNNIIEDCGGDVDDDGIVVSYGTGTNEDVNVIGNQIINQSGNGVAFRGTSRLLIADNIIENPGVNGVNRDTGTAGTDVAIRGNVINSAGVSGIAVGVDSDYSISGNHIRTAGTSYGIQVVSCVDALINNNRIEAATLEGMLLDAVTYSTITGNTVNNNTQSGIRLDNASAYNTVTGNNATNNGAYGYYESHASAINNTVVGNTFYSNTTANIFITAAGSVFKNNHTDTSLSVASATTTTLGYHSDYFNITGTTAITTLTASWAGRIVTLKFAGVLTFTDGNNIKIAGNMSTTADDTITLVCDGTNWYEMGRSAN